MLKFISLSPSKRVLYPNVVRENTWKYLVDRFFFFVIVFFRELSYFISEAKEQSFRFVAVFFFFFEFQFCRVIKRGKVKDGKITHISGLIPTIFPLIDENILIRKFLEFTKPFKGMDVVCVCMEIFLQNSFRIWISDAWHYSIQLRWKVKCQNSLKLFNAEMFFGKKQHIVSI